jgi:CRP/FNR family transcriptional regulator
MALSQSDLLKDSLRQIGDPLKKQILEESTLQEIPEDTEILRAGQYVKVIPIVVSGLIKVFTRQEDKELLLYYIRPNESCIMSFASSLQNSPSKVFAKTEEATKALLIPVDKVPVWQTQFPDINTLFFQQFNLRYAELLETIHHLIFDKLDTRLLNYLSEKVKLTNKNPLKISHRQIAAELGTAREVISRVMKKLEAEGKLKQHSSSIEIF